jgi:N-acetylmuramoyl-L-alanine amidase
VRTALQPENSRQAAVISDSVYLMSHISCPAILVECGFLSNAQEEELLGDPTYQQKLAAVLLAGYLQGPVSP